MTLWKPSRPPLAYPREFQRALIEAPATCAIASKATKAQARFEQARWSAFLTSIRAAPSSEFSIRLMKWRTRTAIRQGIDGWWYLEVRFLPYEPADLLDELQQSLKGRIEVFGPDG